jgi:hypothetical protein
MLRMTPAQTRAHGLMTPSLPQLWLTAMLRALVELVQSVVSNFQMPRRRPHVIGTQAMPADLPGAKSGSDQGNNPVAASDSQPSVALILVTWLQHLMMCSRVCRRGAYRLILGL